MLAASVPPCVARNVARLTGGGVRAPLPRECCDALGLNLQLLGDVDHVDAAAVAVVQQSTGGVGDGGVREPNGDRDTGAAV
jgi:hypothetical protein